MKIAIVYATNLGNTAAVAAMIGKEMKVDAKHIYDVNETDPEELAGYDGYVFGTSTWGIGDMLDGWKEFDFRKLGLDGKTVALFGLGDSQIYAFSFCNGLGELCRAIRRSCRKARLVGQTDAKSFAFSDSKAVEDGKFVGLALDYDNFPDRVPKLIKTWVKGIKKEFI